MHTIKSFLKTHSQKIIALMLVSLVLYGAGRLYFQLTAGFTIGNITTDIAQEPDWGIAPVSANELANLESILNQPYTYLGKGCQSYVFKSNDGKYVIKFLKLQRFRPQNYLNLFSFIPAVEKVREKKAESKRKKLNELLSSWKIAYEDLRPETGLVYLHLNETQEFHSPLLIYDKMGFRHEIDPNKALFLVQNSAEMLCSALRKKNSEGAKEIISRLMNMLLSEYQRGLGDNDHALMQNTGVRDDQPLHIDVGQFSKEPRFKDPQVYHGELFSKTYKFRIWLAKHYPELETYLAGLLFDEIGPAMETMKPALKTVDEGL